MARKGSAERKTEETLVRVSLELDGTGEAEVATGVGFLDHLLHLLAHHAGMDLVVEGQAVRVTDDDRLRELAQAWESKYGGDWHFDVADGTFHHPDGGTALVFEVRPAKAWGFGREGEYSATRWTF